MKKYYIIVALALVILGGAFYWYELHPLSLKRDCFTKADTAKQTALNADDNVITSGLELTKRADYEKIFNDEYSNCLMGNGIKE